MTASFVEKSVWIQLIGVLVACTGYFIIAGLMLASGVDVLVAFVGPFIAAVVLQVVIQVAGHILAAITSRRHEPDERDRLIEWRAESNAAWIVTTGVFAGITCLLFDVGAVWTANVLFASVFLSEIFKYTLQLVYYRRGV